MLIKIKILIVILLLITGGCLIFLNLVYSSNNQDSGEKIFIVKKGQGVKDVGNDLYKAKLIKNRLAFETYVNFRKIGKDFLLAGEFKIGKNKSIKEIVDMLISGRGAILEKEIKIVEGSTNEGIGEYLEKEGVLSKEEFIEGIERVSGQIGADSERWLYEFLEDETKNLGLEGYLFPDTYRVYKETTAEEIIKKMLDNFDRKLTKEMREEIEKQGKTIHEIITLASIIEKEIADEKSRKIIAGIFYKRLREGIPLQADSTVNYITGKKALGASLKDTRIDSPYNTYKYKGLPPTSICNPGISAISAAIYPEKSEYYYFLTTPKGEIIFSKTFKEHVLAKGKYLNN